MKPLVTTKKFLTWLCICPLDENSNKSKKLFCIAFSVIFIGNQVVAFAGSLTFFLKYVSIDLEVCLYALFQLAAEVGVMYMIIVAFIHRFKIAALFENLSKIYDESKNRWVFSSSSHYDLFFRLVWFMEKIALKKCIYFYRFHK